MEAPFSSNQSGAILIVVLGMLALLTIIAVSFVFATRMSLRASEAYMRTVGASDIAEAGMANAIAVLEADKIYRTGDRRDATVPITETFDSLRDSWRQSFSAPVVITYPNTALDTDLLVGHTVVNDSTAPARQGAKGKVIAIDRTNDRVYLNSVSPGLWVVGDPISDEDNSGGTHFDTTISSVSKPDEVDLDGDGTYDAVWQNYYDESGALLGRYAVLIQDESSKINVNAAGNLSNDNGTPTDFTDDQFHADEGWKPSEISLEDVLNSPGNAKQIVLYRYGSAQGSDSWPSPTDKRIYLPGQGNASVTPGFPLTYDDDDDNFNRYFYAHDGIDNDGDGTIDEANEGVNEPEEFRPLRPYRTDPWDYDSTKTDGDTYINETNEGDDQPILTLEQLEDDEGVALSSGFLTTPVSTNFDGVTSTSRERRNFISTMSHDRNLNKEGQLRTNPNFASPEQTVSTVKTAFKALTVADTDDLEYPDLRNMQVAANIYDYRDRGHGRTEVQDSAGDVFAGVEAIRINEVLVRAATTIYEAELANVFGTWDLYTLTDPNPYLYGAKSPLPNGVSIPYSWPLSPGTWVPDYLRNLGTSASTYETSNPIRIDLPDPPFSNAGAYTFKLRIRVRSNGGAINSADSGFSVFINQTGTPPTSPVANPTELVNPASGINSVYGPSLIPARWATQNPGTGINNWYVEEALVSLQGGGTSNYLFFQTIQPTPPNSQVDTIDIDWLYFTQEPDCEWLELANIGDLDINVNNWKIVSEYVMDTSNSVSPAYAHVRNEVTLPDISIPKIDSTVGPIAPPQYVVFTIDRDDGGSAATAGNGICFANTWTALAAAANYANVHQIQSVYNIYSGWMDFFGNAPLDDNNDTTGPINSRYYNVDSGTVSLYDSLGNLVDRVTYTLDQAREGFRSLQKNHPANPGERMDSSMNFKKEAFTGTSWTPLADYTVSSDGDYDDWQFAWDRGPTGTLPDPERYLWLWSTPTEANNVYSDTTVTGAANIAAEYNDIDKRVQMPDCRVKDRYFTSPGELTHLQFYHDYAATVAYTENVLDEDEKLVPGKSVIENVTASQGANLLSKYTVSGEARGWIVVKGNASNPVNLWRKGQNITCGDLGATFDATIVSVKPIDRLMGNEIDHYLEIGYDNGADPDPVVGQITNQSKTPPEYGTVTARDTTNKYIQVRMDPPATVTDWKLTEWKVGETIQDSASSQATITSVREKTADVRGLADYFTTSCLDLEAKASAVYSGSDYTRVNWPTASDPEVYQVDLGGTVDIGWDEDAGVLEGTYDLYGMINYGANVNSEVALDLGTTTIKKTNPAEQATLRLTLKNTAAAASQYHFMRAILSPAPYTFGRINANTASKQVLEGLPGITVANDLATSIIRARNMAAFESIGDVYRVSEIDSNFTPEVFAHISNLITTRSDAYKIIVLGQGAIDENRDGIIQENEVISEKKLEMIYQR